METTILFEISKTIHVLQAEHVLHNNIFNNVQLSVHILSPIKSWSPLNSTLYIYMAWDGLGRLRDLDNHVHLVWIRWNVKLILSTANK